MPINDINLMTLPSKLESFGHRSPDVDRPPDPQPHISELAPKTFSKSQLTDILQGKKILNQALTKAD